MALVNFRVDDDVLAVADKAAERAGESRSAFLRRAMVQLAKAEVNCPLLVSDLEFVLQKHALKGV